MPELFLVGEGRLYGAVQQQSLFQDRFLKPLDREPAAGDVLISAHDQWRGPEIQDLEGYATRNGAHFIPAVLNHSLVTVGPWIDPEGSFSALDAEKRRKEVAGFQELNHQRDLSSVLPDPALTLAVNALDALLQSYLQDQTFDAGRVYALRIQDLMGRWHQFHLPAHAGPLLQDDTFEAARIDLQPRIQHNPRSFREKPLAVDRQTLRDHLLDWRYGLMNHTFKTNNTPLALSGVEFQIPGRKARESGWGRSEDFESAEQVAFLEALERYGSQRPRGKRTTVRGSFKDLQPHAFDPRKLGQVTSGYESHPDYRYTPFQEDTVTDWVWGHSFSEGQPVLVPEHLAYYSHNQIPRAERFFYDSSNGCALGASREEATLYGLLEVIERDAFLIAWHTRAPVPEIDLDSIDQPMVQHLRNRLESVGFDLHCFDITTDNGVPAVWALLVNQKDEYPKTLSAAGAHFDPNKALLGGLIEVAVNAFVHERHAAHTDEALLAMLEDPTLVKTLDDHVAVNAHPAAFERHAFLLQADRKKATLQDLYPDWQERWVRDDLTDVLKTLLQKLQDLGQEVISIDQTPPQSQKLGFSHAKVIVTGMLPMVFGHLNQRIDGFPRLLQVPLQKGYTPSFHRDPHPFP